MTYAVKDFIETNYQLLDTNPAEFFHRACNELTIYCQNDLVEALDTAGIDTYKYREMVLRYIITMDAETLYRPITLRTWIARQFEGSLGFSAEWLFDYILENASEWDIDIKFENGGYVVYPKEM